MFFEDWKLFDQKSIEIYHILCIFSVDYNVVGSKVITSFCGKMKKNILFILKCIKLKCRCFLAIWPPGYTFKIQFRQFSLLLKIWKTDGEEWLIFYGELSSYQPPLLTFNCHHHHPPPPVIVVIQRKILPYQNWVHYINKHYYPIML